MAKKQRVVKPARYVSKHQLSKWQRQKRRQRITSIAGISVIAVVLLVFGLGYFNSQVRPYMRKVIEVNGTTFDMRYYINTLAVYNATYGGGQLNPQMADYVEKQIQHQELIRQGAGALGIEPDRAAAEADLKEAKVPVTRERVDMQIVSNLVDKLRDDYFKPKVPATQPQVNLQAMLLDSETSANKAKARVEAGESFNDIAGELSLDSFTRSKKGDFGWTTPHVADLLVDSTRLGDMASSAAVGELNGPAYDDSVSKDVGYWIVKVTETAGDPQSDTDKPRVHAFGILAGSEDEAKSVKDKLSSGADFAELARELSQDPVSKDTGGDLGWISAANASGDLQTAAVKMQADQVSDPIRDSGQVTSGGYWLYRVTERDDNKELGEDQTSMLVAEALNKWAEDLPADPNNKVKSFLNEELKMFALTESFKVDTGAPQSGQ